MRACLRHRYSLLAALSAFVVGICFDLTAFRFEQLGLSPPTEPILLLLRGCNGLLLALIAGTLLWAGQKIWTLAQVNWWQLLFLWVAVNVFTALYVRTTHTVYVWDNAGYWTVAQELAAQKPGLEQIFTVLQSTVTMEYNHLLAWPISMVMKMFGGSRAVFLFTISNLYTFPGLWGLCAMARARRWGGIVLAGLFPAFVYLGLVGFVDVAAASLAIWAVVIYTSNHPPICRGICSGVLLVATFLLRRYFFFFAASFGLAALMVKLLFERRQWRDFLALLLSSALCALVLTPNFLVEQVLGGRYGDLYSAYALGLASDGKLFSRYFGLLPLLALLGGGMILLACNIRQKELAFGLIQLLTCFAAFVSIQSHGQQHLLLYLPSLALLAAVLLPRSVPPGLLVSALLWGWCLIPKEQPASIDAIPGTVPLPSFTFYGPVREDMDELIRLADYVDALSSQTPATAVVLASSLTLNHGTLANLRPSLQLPQPAVSTILQYHGTVDKRDAFNWNTLSADYLILGIPIQTHLGEENQQVLVQFARHVLDGTGPGTAYEPLPVQFTLSHQTTVRIYRRTRNLTSAEYHQISDGLTALYPAYAGQYAVPDWVPAP